MRILNYFTRVNESAALMEAMIGKLKLTEALGTLPDHRNVLRRAADRCLHCESPEACAKWLADNDKPTEAPAYCKNHDLFARVSERLNW